MDKELLFEKGVELANHFCLANEIPMPKVVRLVKNSPDPLMRRYYSCIGSCAFYRQDNIYIAVEKCASPGMGGRAWSWPGYTVDRTPYGVVQHELGHHIDSLKSSSVLKVKEDLFSYRIWLQSKEKPLTGYLGTDKEDQTFYKEWFAENFRLFVTNPDLSRRLRPKFFSALVQEIEPLDYCIEIKDWEEVLKNHQATERIIEQARKKINYVQV